MSGISSDLYNATSFSHKVLLEDNNIHYIVVTLSKVQLSEAGKLRDRIIASVNERHNSEVAKKKRGEKNNHHH